MGAVSVLRVAQGRGRRGGGRDSASVDRVMRGRAATPHRRCTTQRMRDTGVGAVRLALAHRDPKTPTPQQQWLYNTTSTPFLRAASVHGIGR